jgi:hypothetical protein
MPEKFELPKLPKLPFTKESSNPGEGPKIEDFLPALPPDLPLPKFVVEQMKKK